MILLPAFRDLCQSHMNRGASQSDIAKLCRVSQKTVSKWLDYRSTTGSSLHLEHAIMALGGCVYAGLRSARGGPGL